MKHIVWKAFWDFEKEENWLSGMASKGLAMTDMVWWRYVFEDTPPGEYTYRLELLEKSPERPENRAYFRFLKDTGVEHVASYQNWIYLRKKAADGPFQLYTDLDSRIRHYKTVQNLWTWVSGMGLGAGLVNLAAAIVFTIEKVAVPQHWFFGILLILFGLIYFLFLRRPLSRKIKALRSEREIYE